MWPWGHAAVGFVGYLAVTYLRDEPLPSERAVLALLLGTQFPDLVDKPLSWTLGVLPSGRSLAHSLITAAVVVGVLYVLVDARRRRLVTAFAFGYVSHVLGDAIYPLAVGRYWELGYLLWPVLPVPTYETRPDLLAVLGSIEASPGVLLGVGVLGGLLVAWRVALARERRRSARAR